MELSLISEMLSRKGKRVSERTIANQGGGEENNYRVVGLSQRKGELIFMLRN